MNDVLVFLIFVLGIYLLWRSTGRVYNRQGAIELGGYAYPYIIGDKIVRYYTSEGRMHGIDISLPKEFPHIYLDGHLSDGVRGPRYYFHKSDMISLEGDFDKHFQTFAPSGYQALALSIISPDVMAILIDNAGKYDVEIFGSHLRIISRDKVYGKLARETEILAIAQAVLNEIAHRLKSWSAADSAAAHKASLKIYDEQSLKFGRKYLRSTTAAAIIGFGAMSLMFHGLAFWIYKTSDHHEGLWLLIVAGVLSFPGVFIYTLIANRRSKFTQR